MRGDRPLAPRGMPVVGKWLIEPAHIDTTKHFFDTFGESGVEGVANKIVRNLGRMGGTSEWPAFLLKELGIKNWDGFIGSLTLYGGPGESWKDHGGYIVPVTCSGDYDITRDLKPDQGLWAVTDMFILKCFMSTQSQVSHERLQKLMAVREVHTE